MKLTGRFAAGISALLLLPLTAAAQGNADRFQRQLELIQRDTLFRTDQAFSLTQRSFIDYGAFANYGYLSVDDNNDQNHILNQYQLVGYLRANFDGAQEIFIRGLLTYNDFNPGDAFEENQDFMQPCELDRWYYRFDLRGYQAAYNGRQIDYNVVVEAGRDLQYWGNGLVLSLDLMGVTVTTSWGGTDLTFLGGVTPENSVDIDSSRPNFDDDTTRGFYGVMAAHTVGQHTPYIYALMQRDYNSDNVSTVGPVETTFDYNSYYLGIGSSGSFTDRLLYGVEAVYQGGTNKSNSFVVGGPFLTPIEQTEDNIQAWAADARIDYVFPDERHSRLSGEVIIASGDSDRLTGTNTFGGNKPNTNDNAFIGFGSLNTGLAFAPAVTNLLAFRAGGSSFPLVNQGPLRRIQVGSDVFVYFRLDADAPIDEPTIGDSKYLGWEPDFYLNWQVTSDVTIIARYGIFFPSSDTFQSDEARQYIYGGITYAF